MTSRNVLLLGSTSFTGSHILDQLAERHAFRRVGRDRALADVTFDVHARDPASLAAELDWADVVVNCFSNGDVDRCETDPGPSRRLNLDFPVALARLQPRHDFDLIHFSSNAVYDGETPPYSERSEHRPVNTYGRLKSEADRRLMDESDRCTVLRPITMFGRLLGNQRHNPFLFFFERLRRNENVVAVNDVYVNMLHVDTLVECVQAVLERRAFGEFNVSGDDVVNRFEFVSEIKRLLPSSTSTVTETDSAGFETAARRPRDTSFDNARMKDVLGVRPEPLGTTLEGLVAEALEGAGSAAGEASRRAA